MNITEFLTARLDEREAIAQRAMTDWNDQDWVELDGDPLDHIGANDPHAVLADIAAKRAILQAWAARGEDDHPAISAHRTGLWLAIQHLAQPYAEHPDFDESWKP